MFSLFTRSASNHKIVEKRSLSKALAAFTLIELMVTITLATIIMAVVLFQNNKFNSSIILTNAAYEVALTIRQAQVYGLGSRAVAGADTRQAYGTYVSILNNNTAKFIRLFADTGTVSGFTAGAYDAAENMPGGVQLGRGLYVKDLCYKLNGVAESCYNGGAGSSTYVSTTILFQRPDPEAKIKPAIGGGNDGAGTELKTAEYVKIVLGVENEPTSQRCVLAYRSGQISVKTSC